MSKIALVTGGSRGIGAACVNALHAAGYIVAVASRTRAECEHWFECDLTDELRRSALVGLVIERMGGLDLLVNNAGAQGHIPAADTPLTVWHYQIDLMLTAPFILSRDAAKHMQAHGGGHIVNILSTSAFQGARNVSPYIAAKHGLLGLTKAMSIELAPLIHVNAIAPGLTVTDMTAEYIPADRRALLESITPAGRFGKPEEIADALVWLAGTDYVYGQTIVVDGGWLAKNG